MRGKRLVVVVVAGAVAWGVALPPAQGEAPRGATELAPANVVYTFNKIRPGGIVRDVSPPSRRPMLLKGNWNRAADVDGNKKAVAFQARSLGVIRRSAPLIPRHRSFAVAMTVKVRKFVGSDSPNLAQVGYYRQRGQWKVELLPATGRVFFRVKGAAGTDAVVPRISIDDGQYHQVICFRKRHKIGVIVDGVKSVKTVTTGAVLNPRKVTIGNKNLKAAADQFRGNYDYFAMALGRNPIARAVAKAPAIP